MSTFSDAVLALSPTSYWRFSGGALTDSGSAGITLSAVSSPVQVPSIIPCEARAANEAYELNGTSMYFTGGNNYNLVGVDHSVFMWISPYHETFSGFNRFIEKRDSSSPNTGWMFYGSPDNNLTWDHDPGVPAAEGLTEAGNIFQRQSYFVGFTWKQSTTTISIYRNGVRLGQKNTWTDSTWGTHTSPLTIGASAVPGNYFNGIVDDVAIWNGTELNTTQVSDLFSIASIPPSTPNISFVSQSRVF